jgi:hypothetical protein
MAFLLQLHPLPTQPVEPVVTGQAPVSLDLLCEVVGHDKAYKVLDAIVLQEGFGKNKVQLPDGQIYTEYFTVEFLQSLLPLLEGCSVQVVEYKPPELNGNSKFSHPPSDVNRMTPTGLLRNAVGWIRDAIIESRDGKTVIRAKVLLSDVPEALHIRQLLQSAEGHKLPYPIGLSINGEGLFNPGTRQGILVIEAVTASLLRSVELVSSPAAGGRILAVLESEKTHPMRTLVQAIRQYCKEQEIAFNAHAKTPTSLLASIDPAAKQSHGLLLQAEMYVGDGKDDQALAVVNGMLSVDTEPAKMDDEPAADEQETEPAADALDTDEVDLEGTETELDAVEAQTSPPVIAKKGVNPFAKKIKGKKVAVVAPVTPVTEAEVDDSQDTLLGQLVEGQQMLTETVTAMQKIMKNVVQAQKQSAQVMRSVQQSTDTVSQEQQAKAVEAYIQRSGLPTNRVKFYMNQYEQDLIPARTIRQVVESEAKEYQTMQGRFGDFGPLGGAAMVFGPDAADKNLLRTKLLFLNRKDLTESEQKLVVENGIEPFSGIKHMYQHYIPDDEKINGVPFGGGGASKMRMYREMVEAATETLDFATILRNVLDQRAVKRWAMREMRWQEICEEGTPFTDYRDSNIIVPSQASDMPEVTETGGYGEAAAPHRKREVVTESAKEYGRRLRWTKWVILNDQTDIITDDSDAEVDAMYNTIARKVWDMVLGYGPATVGGVSACNTLPLSQDALGVLYSVVNRKNYVVGSLSDYDKVVQAVALMQHQRDDSAAGFTEAPLELSPAHAVCVNTKVGWVKGIFTGAYKPSVTGSNVPNDISFPGINVIGLHPDYLRGHDEGLFLLPATNLYAGIRVRYFQGQRTPRLVWQNMPQVGNVFEYGHISLRIEFPIRLTLVRKKAFYAVANF